MKLTKISHQTFNNGKENLDTKSFLKHDLLHYVIDEALGLYDEENPTVHSVELEQVAGILHAIYDDSVSDKDIIEGAQNMFSAHGKELPQYLDSKFVNSVRVEALRLLRCYEFLKTGESMEIE